MLRELEFKVNGDGRGNLVALEGAQDIPFEIKRIFFIYGAEGPSVRGRHANLKSEFVLINVSGQSRVRVDDGRGNRETVLLDRPDKGIFIPRMHWKEMFDFSRDAVLLVLSNEHYDPDEYVRSYEEFVRLAGGKGEH